MPSSGSRDAEAPADVRAVRRSAFGTPEPLPEVHTAASSGASERLR